MTEFKNSQFKPVSTDTFKLPEFEDITQPEYTPSGVPERLTRDQILSNPAYMSIIKNTMSQRFGLTDQDKSRTVLDRTKAGAGWFLGQRATGNDFESMSDEDLFETWQNYMRSFSGGQSVSVAAEVAFHRSASPEQKKAIGQGYQLYDSMPNIFSEDSSWGEMFDGMGDYTRAAIWDPSTIIGLGVGKLLTAAGTKATAQTIKGAYMSASKAALQRGLSGIIAKQEGKKAASIAFKQRLSQTAKTTGTYMLLDLPFAIGADLGWQSSMLETGQQEEWYQAQTAISALGAMILPATIAGFKGVQALGDLKGAEKIGADNYVRITEALKGQMQPQAVEKAVLSNINGDIIQDRLGILLGDIKDNLENYPKWYQEVATPDGMPAHIGASESDFFKALLLGDESRGIDGLAKILSDAGVVYVPRGDWDKPSNFLGDIISLLPKESWQKVAEEMSLLNKVRPDLLPKDTFKTFSSEELGSYFKKRASNLGRDLAVISSASRTLTSKKVPTASDILKGLSAEAGETGPQRLKFAQNIYKRLLTAHPGTTGLNVKGWAAASVLNTTADVVEGVLLMGSGAVKRGNFKKGVSTISGAIRRGYNVLNWIDSVAAAEDYLSTRKDIREKLHQFIAGGVESTKAQKETFEKLGLDPNSKINKSADSFANAMQTISGVKLQDEMTKQLAFISSLDAEIRKAYGVSFNEFMAQDDAWAKMASKEFKQVEKTALERTLRETFSKSYTLSNSDSVMRDIAKGIESFSNSPGVGFLIPFGQFFNNATATMADYSGVNFLRWALGKSLGKTIDVTEQQGLNLLAKGAVGFSAMALYFIPKAEEKIESGLSWKQERGSDGSISDLTYDFPMSAFLVTAQLIAHSRRSGEIPPDLAMEASQILTGQLTRDLTETGSGMGQVGYALLDTALGSGDAVDLNALEVMSESASRIISGYTRWVDPVNQFAALLKEDYSQMDRRQGIKFINDSLRYVDQIFDVGTSDEVRIHPFNEPAPQDTGRVLGGMRSSQAPSTSERMLASVGKPTWRATRWPGDDPELKNHLDSLLQPVIDSYSKDILAKHPDFFSYPLAKKESLVNKMLTDAKNEVKETLEAGLSPADSIMSKLKTINGYSKRDQNRALRTLGFEGSINDIIDADGADWALSQIIDVLQNPDSYLGLE